MTVTHNSHPKYLRHGRCSSEDSQKFWSSCTTPGRKVVSNQFNLFACFFFLSIRLYIKSFTVTQVKMHVYLHLNILVYREFSFGVVFV